MNAKEAREILRLRKEANDLSLTSGVRFEKNYPQEWESDEARGYLKCFDQVRPLVEALEQAVCDCRSTMMGHRGAHQKTCMLVIAKKALSHWREVQGEK